MPDTGRQAGRADEPREAAAAKSKPCSRKVGTAGKAGKRAGAATPSARMRPSRCSAIASLMLPTSRSMCPPSRDCVAGALPAKGTCTCIREGHGECECKLAVRAGLPGATVCALVP